MVSTDVTLAHCDIVQRGIHAINEAWRRRCDNRCLVRQKNVIQAAADLQNLGFMYIRPRIFANPCVATNWARSALLIGRGVGGAGVIALTLMAAASATVASAQDLATSTEAAEAPSCAGVPLAASPGEEPALVDPAKDLRGAIASGPGDRDWGEWLAGECLACHGLNAKAAASIPPLAQLDPMAFASALEEYRRHLRLDPGMRLVAARLAPDEVAALAAYFASLPPENAADAVPALNR